MIKTTILSLLMILNFNIISNNTVEKPTIEEIEKVKDYKPGGYYITIKYKENGKELSKVVMMNVVSKESIVKNNKILDASDFTISINEADKISNNSIVRKSSAKAWDSIDGTQIKISEISHNIIPLVGSYHAMINAEGLTKKINVQVIENDIINDYNQNKKNINTEYEDYHNILAPKDESSNWYLNILQFTILAAIITPIGILLVEYIITLRIYNKVIKLLTNK